MDRCRSTLLDQVGSSVVLGVALTVMTLMTGCADEGGSQPLAMAAQQLPVSSDLHAVAEVVWPVTSASSTLIEPVVTHVAAGSGGTVVALFASQPWADAAVSNVGADVELRGVAGQGHTWWVVGDAGFIAVTEDHGLSWTKVELGITADLHAIAWVADGIVIVGDELVRVGQDDVWLEPPTPVGGWGELRGVAGETGSNSPSTVAVGLGGVIWSTKELGGAWIAEDSGVGTDLFAVGADFEELLAVGADGTLLRRLESGAWSGIATGISEDLIDVEAGDILAADGEVWSLLGGDDQPARLWSGPLVGARAVARFSVAVGDAGMAWTTSSSAD